MYIICVKGNVSLKKIIIIIYYIKLYNNIKYKYIIKLLDLTHIFYNLINNTKNSTFINCYKILCSLFKMKKSNIIIFCSIFNYHKIYKMFSKANHLLFLRCFIVRICHNVTLGITLKTLDKR